MTPPSLARRLLSALRPRRIRDALRRNPGLKLISLVLAFLLWFSTNVSERDAERIVDLRVSIRKIAPNLIVTNPPTKPVTVTLRGPRTILDGVDEERGRIALDLSGVAPGETRIELGSEMVRPELPRRVSVVRLEPGRLRLTVERLARRRVPVRLDLAGTPALGYMIAESQVQPGEVEVTGPARIVEGLKEVSTDPIDLQGVAATQQREAQLAWVGDFVTFAPDRVVTTIVLDEIMVAREFKGVEVRVVVPDGVVASVRPRRVDLTISGPQRLLHNFRVQDGAITVSAAGLAPGTHRVAPTIDLPAALEVTRWKPETVSLEIASGGGS